MPDDLTPVRSAILALRFDWFDLEQQLPPGGGQRLGVTGRTDDGGQVPIQMGALALQERIWWLTTGWEEPVREAANLRAVPARRVRPGTAVTRATGLLAEFVQVMLTLDAVTFNGYPDTAPGQFVEVTGRQGVDHLLITHRLARAALGLTRRVKAMFGPCPQCRRLELRTDEPDRAGAAVTVYCGYCDHRMTENDYEKHVRSLVVRL